LSRPIEFKKRAVKDDYDLVVYEATIDKSLFGYLYVKPETYSLAWTAPRDFRFTGKHVCEFIEWQFSNLGPVNIELLDEEVPWHEHNPKAIQKKLFSYEASKAYLIFAGEDEENEESEDFEEYDLFNEPSRNRYTEVLKSDEVSELLFVRYELNIITYEKEEGSKLLSQTGRHDCRFTVEDRRGTPADGWELAFSLPTTLGLKDRTLKWVAKNHRDADFWRSVNFDQSLSALHEALNR